MRKEGWLGYTGNGEPVATDHPYPIIGYIYRNAITFNFVARFLF